MSEKRPEKETEEKGRNDSVGNITFAAILIWGGIVALISVANLVYISWWHGWWVFFTGLGVILLVQAAVRLLPQYRRPVTGTIILAIIFLAIGLANLLGAGWRIVLPVIIIVIGVVIVLRQLMRR